MKNKINLLLISLVTSIGLFAYLTLHHFQVQLGTNGSSICSINSKINCDAAALSSYSELFGIPISVFGLAFGLVMFCLVFFKKMDWFELSPHLNFFVKFLFLISGLVSVLMAIISLFKVNVICPFCWATYITAFINLYLAYHIFRPSKFKLTELITHQPNLTLAGAFIVLTWFISAFTQNQFGLDNIKKYAPEKVAAWQNSLAYNFDASLGLTQNSSAENSIVEFADFKCPHCKVAAESLHNFMIGKSNVKFNFKTFPLDGVCNPHIPQKGDGSRCKMAAWALCSEKMNQKGWQVSKWYFDHQEELMFVSDLKETNQKISASLNLNFEETEKCSDSVETLDLIKKMADEGKAANVQGTPSIYVNSKRIDFSHGQLNYLLKLLLPN